jgi:hypothetical protein
MENGCVDNKVADEECAMAGAAPGCYYFYNLELCKKPTESIFRLTQTKTAPSQQQCFSNRTADHTWRPQPFL